MTNSKSFNRSPKQRALYHALMEPILEDENAMDEGVADKLKKRKQDDADKDEGPFTGLDRGLKRQKTSKDTKPSKKAKSTETSKGTSKGTKEYPFDLSKPLLLIMERGHQVVPVDYFINNDLEYLKGGSSSIEDMVPSNRLSKYDVYSTKRIIAVTKVKAIKWYDYDYLEEIKVRREDHQLYKFKEGDFPRLYLHDIEDMMLLLVQKKISNIERDVIFDLGVALGMFTRHIVILKRVEYLQLGFEIYRKKLNITKP
ncbi:hypothetical protein Tco_1314482 [Tanacetum coccineum]